MATAEGVRKRPLAKVSLRMAGSLDIADMTFLFVTANRRNVSVQALSVRGDVEAMA